MININPTKIPVGSDVTIEGSHFSPAKNDNIVQSLVEALYLGFPPSYTPKKHSGQTTRAKTLSL